MVFSKKEQTSIQAGFTLVELLIVIAIMALLASIVLGSLAVMRQKGNDGTIKGNLASLRSQVQLYQTNTGTFGPLIAGGDCNAVSTVFTDPQVSSIIRSISAVALAGAPTCQNTVNTWAVSVPLNSPGGGNWCVDSGGMVTSLPSPIAGPVCI